MGKSPYLVLKPFIEHVPGFGMVVGNAGETVSIPDEIAISLASAGMIDAENVVVAGVSAEIDLTKLKKAELVELAAAEGVEIEAGAKAADIIAAIELMREEAVVTDGDAVADAGLADDGAAAAIADDQPPA